MHTPLTIVRWQKLHPQLPWAVGLLPCGLNTSSGLTSSYRLKAPTLVLTAGRHPAAGHHKSVHNTRHPAPGYMTWHSTGTPSCRLHRVAYQLGTQLAHSKVAARHQGTSLQEGLQPSRQGTLLLQTQKEATDWFHTGGQHQAGASHPKQRLAHNRSKTAAPASAGRTKKESSGPGNIRLGQKATCCCTGGRECTLAA